MASSTLATGQVLLQFDYEKSLNKATDAIQKKLNGLDFSKLSASKKEIEELASAFGSVNTNLKETRTLMTKTATSAKSLAKSLRDIKSANDSVNNSKKQSQKENDKLEAQNIRLKAKISDLSGEAKRYAQQVLENNKVMTQAEKANMKVKEDSAKASDRMARQQIQSNRDALISFTLLAREIQRVTNAMYDGIKSATLYGAKIEQSLTVTGAIAKASDSEFQQLKNTVSSLGQEAPVALDKITNSMYSLASAGLDATEIIQAMPSALKLSVGVGEDLGKVMSALVSTVKGFNKDFSDSTDILDLFANSVASSQATIDKLQVSFARVAPLAEQSNVSLEEVTAQLSKLYDIGLSGSRAGTVIVNVLTRLNNFTDKSEKALRKAGLSAYDVSLQYNSLGNVLSKVSKAIDEQRISADQLQDIFGTRGKLITTITDKISAGLKDGATDVKAYEASYKEFIATISDSSGAIDDFFDKQKDTAQFAIDRYKNAVSELKIVVSDANKDAFVPMVNVLTETINNFNELAKTSDIAKNAIRAYSALAFTAKGLTSILSQLSIVLLAVNAGAFNGFGTLLSFAKNPYILGFSVVLAGIGLAYTKMVNRQIEDNKRYEESLKDLNGFLKENKDASIEVIEKNEKHRESLEKLRKETGQTIETLNELNTVLRNREKLAELQAKKEKLLRKQRDTYSDLGNLKDDLGKSGSYYEGLSTKSNITLKENELKKIQEELALTKVEMKNLMRPVNEAQKAEKEKSFPIQEAIEEGFKKVYADATKRVTEGKSENDKGYIGERLKLINELSEVETEISKKKIAILEEESKGNKDINKLASLKTGFKGLEANKEAIRLNISTLDSKLNDKIQEEYNSMIVGSENRKEIVNKMLADLKTKIKDFTGSDAPDETIDKARKEINDFLLSKFEGGGDVEKIKRSIKSDIEIAVGQASSLSDTVTSTINLATEMLESGDMENFEANIRRAMELLSSSGLKELDGIDLSAMTSEELKSTLPEILSTIGEAFKGQMIEFSSAIGTVGEKAEIEAKKLEDSMPEEFEGFADSVSNAVQKSESTFNTKTTSVISAIMKLLDGLGVGVKKIEKFTPSVKISTESVFADVISMIDIDSLLSKSGSVDEYNQILKDYDDALDSNSGRSKEATENLIEMNQALLESQKRMQSLTEIAGSLSQIGSILGNNAISDAGSILGSGIQGAESFSKFQQAGNSLGSLAGLSAGLGMAGAGLAIGSTLIDMAGLGDQSEELAQIQQEELAEWNEQTQLLEGIQSTLENNLGGLLSLTNKMVEMIGNPTQSNLKSGTTILEGISDTIFNQDRDFGDLAVKYTESKSKGLFKGSEDIDFTELYGIEDLLGVNVQSATVEQLQSLSDQLSNTTIDQIESLTGLVDITETNFDEVSEAIDAYIDLIQTAKKEAEDFAKTATLSDFEGIDASTVKSMYEDLKKAYEDAGIEITLEIEQQLQKMAEDLSVQETITQQVRDGFVDGFANGESIADGLLSGAGSVISGMLSNVSKVYYDTVLDDFNTTVSDFYKTFSTDLEKAKTAGEDALSFAENYDYSSLLQAMIEAQALDDTMDGVTDNIREQAEALGISAEIIDEMLGDTERVKLRDGIKSAIESGIKDGFDSGEITSEDIRESVVGQLIDKELANIIDKILDNEEIKEAIGNLTDGIVEGGLESQEGILESLLSLVDEQVEEFADEIDYLNKLKDEIEDDATTEPIVFFDESNMEEMENAIERAKNYKVFTPALEVSNSTNNKLEVVIRSDDLSDSQLTEIARVIGQYTGQKVTTSKYI